MVFSASILSMFYFIFTFAVVGDWKPSQLLTKSSYSELSALRLLGLIGLGFGLSFWLLGLMFYVQFWDGGSTYLILGSILLVIVGVSSFIKFSSCNDKFYFSIIIRTIGWLLLGLIVHLGFYAFK